MSPLPLAQALAAACFALAVAGLLLPSSEAVFTDAAVDASAFSTREWRSEPTWPIELSPGRSRPFGAERGSPPIARYEDGSLALDLGTLTLPLGVRPSILRIINHSGHRIIVSSSVEVAGRRAGRTLPSRLWVHSGKHRDLGLLVRLPRRTPPGDYVGTLRLEIDGYDAQEIPVRIRLAAELRPAPPWSRGRSAGTEPVGPPEARQNPWPGDTAIATSAPVPAPP